MQNSATASSDGDVKNSFRTLPDDAGRFGQFGGRFVAETLMPLVLEVEKSYRAARQDPAFIEDIKYYQKHYVGRPSPLYFAPRITAHLGGAKVLYEA